MSKTNADPQSMVLAARSKPPALLTLIEKGGDVNAAGSDGTTPLIAACETGIPENVDALLKAKANPNQFKGTAQNALRMTVRRVSENHLKCLDLLLDGGADPNLPFRSLQGAPAGTALMEACRVGNLRAARRLVAAGADVGVVTALGTPLIYGAMGGHAEVVEFLLSKGADPSYRMPDDPERLQERSGKTACDLAKAGGFTVIAKLLTPSSSSESSRTSSADIKEAFVRLVSVMTTQRPDAKAALRSGANKASLKQLQAALEGVKSAELTTYFQQYDGQEPTAAASFIRYGKSDEQFRLLSIIEVLRELETWRKLLHDGDFKDRTSTAPSGEWYNTNWVPLTSDSLGNSHCIDLDPQSKHPGQVILLWHDNPNRPTISKGLVEWLDALRQQL